MHHNPIPGKAADASARGAEDAVLRCLLDLHPTRAALRSEAIER